MSYEHEVGNDANFIYEIFNQPAFMFNKNSQFFAIKQMNITITRFPVWMRKHYGNKPVNNFVNFANHKH